MHTKNKLCYILPSYDVDTDTHFSYLYDFIDRVSTEMNIFLIIENVKGKTHFKNTAQLRIKTKKGILGRLFEGIRFAEEAQTNGYNDFYVHYSFVGALSALFVARNGRGRVFYWNCGMPWLYKRNWFRERIFRFILKRVELVTGTDSLKQDYSREYSLNQKNIHVMPNWIDLTEFRKSHLEKKVAREKLELPQGKIIVLFVHHLSKRKGADMIFPTVRCSGDMYFVVVGDGPYKSALEKEIEGSKDLKGRIQIEGRKPQNQIHTYLSASDIFFMPSEEEGFPHVLLEAMASGVPYVASDVGSVKDISPGVEYQYVIKERKPENFCMSLRKLKENPIDGNELREHVKKYDVSIAVKKFIKLFA
ncbi:hypothetical protein COB55_00245 [Candidatus Wolfebacteria bacterium]|nr:MAG: hypothetical protein COB55_00245 [Candidatus Wolfebacteria bacterium]